MNRKALVATLVGLAAPLIAQDKPCDLVIDNFPVFVQFRVTGPQTPFFGGLIVAANPTQQHFLQLLPPLLVDFVVVGTGFAQGDYIVRVENAQIPLGVRLYAEGLVFDAGAICGTPVRPFEGNPTR
ncbi:MAG: hypothetical protein IPK26_30875 [Planctomycetes bacterium]|nr:hypothetical protein [Planctomycetota bacterium]